MAGLDYSKLPREKPKGLDYSKLPKREVGLDYSLLPKDQSFEVGFSESGPTPEQRQIIYNAGLPSADIPTRGEPSLRAPTPRPTTPEFKQKELELEQELKKTRLPIPEYQQKQETLDKILQKSPQIVLATAAPYSALIFEGIQQLKNLGVSMAKDESYSVLDDKMLTELLPEDAPTPLKVGLAVAEFGGDIALFSSLANMAGRGILRKTLDDLRGKLIKSGHQESKVEDFIKTVEAASQSKLLNPDVEAGRLKRMQGMQVSEAAKAAPERLSIASQPGKPQEVIVPGARPSDLAIITPQPPVPTRPLVPATELRKFQPTKRTEDEVIIDQQTDAEMKAIVGQAKESRIKEVANAVKDAGAEFIGLQEVPKGEPLAMFNEPRFGSTGAIPLSQVSPDNVAKKINDMAAQFNVMGQNLTGAKSLGRQAGSKIRDPKVYTERQALKRYLLNQAKVVKIAQNDLQKFQSALNEFISKHLPETERGEFTGDLIKARTGDDFKRVAKKVLAHAEKIEKTGARTLTEKEALRGSLQRQAKTSAEAQRTLQILKVQLNKFIRERLPETERGQFMEKLAKATNAQDFMQVTEEVRAKAEELKITGARVITEKEALKRSLQRQAIAAARAESITTKRLQEVKATITNMVKANLPLEERGRFVSAIASAKTGKDVAKVTMKVRDLVDKLQKDEAIADIKKRLERTLDSPSVDVMVKEKLKSIVSAIDFKGVPANVREELRHTQAVLNKKILNGEDVTIPAYLQNAFAVLGRKSIKELSLNELRNLQTILTVAENVGRLKFARRKELYEAEKAERAKDILADVSPIEAIELKVPLPGSRLSMLEKLGNYINETKNQLQKAGVYIHPINVLMDVMDGVKGFAGAHSRMKQQMDTKYGDLLDDMDRYVTTVKQFAVKHNLDERNFERIGVHAYKVQPFGLPYVLNNVPNPAFIDSVKLTPRELELYQMMRAGFDAVTPRTQRTLADLYNTQMRLLPDYFPVMVDKKSVSEIDVFQRVSDLRDPGAFTGMTKTVEQGFAKVRRGTKQKIVLNALQVFEDRMEDELYFIHMQKDIKQFSEIVKSKEYKEAAGDLGALAISEWLDLMARNGGVPGLEHHPIIDSLRVNAGHAMLGFKLSSFLIQPTALGPAIAISGLKNVSRATTNIVLHRKWREFMRDNFPEIRRRGGDDMAFLDLADGALMKGFQEAGMTPLKKADLITAASAALAAYDAHLQVLTGQGLGDEPGPINKQAMILAQRDVQRTQSSSSFKDAPLGLSRAGSFMKSFLQFQSYRLTNWSNFSHDVWRAGVREGNYKRAAEIFFWLTMTKLAETGIRSASKHGLLLLASAVTGGGALAWREIEEEWDNYEKNALLEIAKTPPIIGDVIGMAAFHSSPIPSFQALGTIGQGAIGAVTAKTEGARKKAASRFAESAGTILGVPGISQAAQFLRQMVDVDPQSKRKIR